jgi:hypothetical protein
LAFIRNGQQKEALRELAKEELKDISEVRTKKEVLDLTAKLFPMAKADELLIANEARRCPTCFDST